MLKVYTNDNRTHLSKGQASNLAKLGRYLVSLDPDYLHFDMETYYYDPNQDHKNERDELSAAHDTSACGTVACALGHGPAAGVEVRDSDTDWMDYCERAFGIDFASEDFIWLFAGNWAFTDQNTARHAGERILNYLENGRPHDYQEIMGINVRA